MLSQRWFPGVMEGERVVLRRHSAENLEAFRRWYSDPEVVRLTRYQDGPMGAGEVERFFMSRVLGPDSLTFAIHILESDRLIGTCAFSQLDGDNGSALFHITIGEKDAWGHGYGTEATELMVRHAFERLGLHRVALSVFSFNERAIRSYRKVGFLIEGRSRDAIFRDGRYWDELQMSILEDDWRARHEPYLAMRDGAPVIGQVRRTAAMSSGGPRPGTDRAPGIRGSAPRQAGPRSGTPTRPASA